MQVNLNLRIKYRESFRPFAPAVLAEKVSDYFELDRESPYMLIVAPVLEDRRIPFTLDNLESNDNLLPLVRQKRSDLPAITQWITRREFKRSNASITQRFYDLIKQFEQDTGCGVLVNTSFNVRGEPIVCEPQDAYRCFMRTEMDVLALGDFILFKEEQPEWPEAKGEGLENEDITKVVASGEPSELNTKLAKIFNDSFLASRTATQARRCSVDHDACGGIRELLATDRRAEGRTAQQCSLVRGQHRYWRSGNAFS